MHKRTLAAGLRLDLHPLEKRNLLSSSKIFPDIRGKEEEGRKGSK